MFFWPAKKIFWLIRWHRHSIMYRILMFLTNQKTFWSSRWHSQICLFGLKHNRRALKMALLTTGIFFSIKYLSSGGALAGKGIKIYGFSIVTTLTCIILYNHAWDETFTGSCSIIKGLPSNGANTISTVISWVVRTVLF